MAQPAGDFPSHPGLFSEFPPVSRSAWDQEIRRTLEKQGHSASLEWQLPDGIALPSFFTEEDLAGLPFLDDAAGSYPFARSSLKPGQSWMIHSYLQGNEHLTDRLAEAIDRKSEGVTFAVGGQFPAIPYGKGFSPASIAKVVAGADDRSFLQFFQSEEARSRSQNTFHFLGGTADLLALAKNLPPSTQWSGAFFLDPFLEVLVSGDFYKPEASLFDELASFMKECPDMPVPAVRADLFHNAGASPALELGLTMAAAAELTQILSEQGISVVESLSRISLFQSAGPLYFPEIAKFRATRRLAALLARGFGIEHSEHPLLPQHGVTSFYSLAMVDAHTNLLRSCTEAMSAVLGGARSLVVLPLDAPFDRDDEFTRRLAVNTQLLLRHEGYLDAVIDPAGGSYYLEQATDRIASAAWNIFLEIEATGGYRLALEKGIVQERLNAAGAQRQENLAKRKETILGVNQYPNAAEILSGSEQRESRPPILSRPPAPSSPSSEARLPPVRFHRAAMEFESLRLATEDWTLKSGRRPLVQLLPFGNLAMQRARAAFIAHFFGCAGFEVRDPGSLGTASACLTFAKTLGHKQEKQEKVDAFVLCSADDGYATAIAEILPALKAIGAPVLIAGNPPQADTMRAAGIDDCIHARLNVLETLERYQKRFCA